MEKRIRRLDLDGIEMISIINQQMDFPEHYHDKFCISLIEDGLETIKMADNMLFSEKGQISISNPYEVHANPRIDEDIKISFTTLYVSQDVVDYFIEGKNVKFSHQQLLNPKEAKGFYATIQAIKNQETSLLEPRFKALFKTFETVSELELDERKLTNRKWTELLVMIENNLEKKISLAFLAKFMNMDKFYFAKEFRSKFGLSPINYVLMKKIFKTKKLISEHTNLSQLAYQFDFSDQAHFSKHFKRFVGLSPQAYKKQLPVNFTKIVQDPLE